MPSSTVRGRCQGRAFFDRLMMMVFSSASIRRFLAELATTWVPTRVQNPHYGHNLDISCAWQGVFLGLARALQSFIYKGFSTTSTGPVPRGRITRITLPPRSPGGNFGTRVTSLTEESSQRLKENSTPFLQHGPCSAVRIRKGGHPPQKTQ